jgi:ribosomal protein S27AE
MPDSITCPRCGMTSHNPHDIAQGYCGNCHDWTADAPRAHP